MRNNELLEATLHAVEDHPELHDQSWYFTRTHCGTARCYAGWALHLAGYQPWWDGNHRLTNMVMAPGQQAPYTASCIARNLLGLTYPEGVTLFAPCNTVGMLQEMIKDLCNGDELRDLSYYMPPEMRLSLEGCDPLALVAL